MIILIRIGGLIHTPEVGDGSLAGICGDAFLRSGPPRGPGKAFKSVGNEAPQHFGSLSRAPVAGQTSKTHLKNPARLPSGTQRYWYHVKTRSSCSNRKNLPRDCLGGSRLQPRRLPVALERPLGALTRFVGSMGEGLTPTSYSYNHENLFSGTQKSSISGVWTAPGAQ